MSEKSKELSMMELCRFYEDRNRRIFGERTPPPESRQPPNGAGYCSSVQPQISLRSTNTSQQRKPQGVKEATNLIVTQTHAEQRPVWTTLQSPNHDDHLGNYQEIMARRMPQPPLARQRDVDEGSGGKTVAMIRKQRYRPSGLTQSMGAGPIARDSHVTIVMITKTATSMEGATDGVRESKEMVPRHEPLRNNQVTEGHLAAEKHPTKARNDQTTATLTDSSIANRNKTHVRLGRRIAIQHRNNDHVYSPATSMEGATGEVRESQEMVPRHEPLRNKQATEGHLAAEKHPPKARDDQTTTTLTDNSIASRNRICVRPGRRIAIQRGNNDLVYSPETCMEGATGEVRESQEMVRRQEPLRNNQVTEGHLAAEKHPTKARDDQTTTTLTDNSIANRNRIHGRPGQRIAIQHGNNDHQYSPTRRNGVCSPTDRAPKQELTFIRVLRKRF